MLPEDLSSCLVFTPRRLADAMVQAIRQGTDQTWLEPSCGRGVFLEAIHAAGVSESRILGIDLDSQACSTGAHGRVLRGMDFVGWSSRAHRRFDCVVGNPPFIAIGRLPEPFQSRAASVTDLAGHAIGRRANLWYAFVLRAIRLLRRGGHLALLLPAACEYANYCALGRKQITRQFSRVDIVRSRIPLFETVQEGSAVLVCQGKGGESHLFRRHVVADVNAAIDRLKSLRKTGARLCRPHGGRQNHNVTRFGDVMTVHLGGVTGDADFFVLTEKKRRGLALPVKSVRPVVSRARHLGAACIDRRAWKSLRDKGERVWLFRPSKGVRALRAVRTYCRLTIEAGGCQRERYKVRNRTPWYWTKLPRRPDAFISGMTGNAPWMCFNEMRGLNATNTLYAVRFRRRFTRTERYAWALSLLTTPAVQQLRRMTRIYADGLRKIEPGQLAELELPVPPDVPDAVRQYRRAVRALMQGDVNKCRAIADGLILGHVGALSARRPA